jgi:hypothetical protein
MKPNPIQQARRVHHSVPIPKYLANQDQRSSHLSQQKKKKKKKHKTI